MTSQLHPLPTNLQDGCEGALVCLSEWSYTVTDGLFFTIALLGFVIVLFMATLSFGSRRAFGFAGFVAIAGSLFLATLELIPYWIASGFIIAGVISLGVLVMGRERR